MAKFSERYAYTNPSSVLIREKMTDEIINSICTAYDLLAPRDIFAYNDLEKHLWCYFFNKRLNDFNAKVAVATRYIESSNSQWYEKLDLIEETLSFFERKGRVDVRYRQLLSFFVIYLNTEFKRLNFAYRIIDNQIIEVTSEEEITVIETALQNSSNSVKEHLQTALKSLSNRPDGDYRNSIKESISAVEAIVREITDENTLNLTELEKNGIILPPVLKKSFGLLYGYTNDKSTGIRHALMDGTNVPGAEEAIFMLVACSAFINYLTKKKI